MSKSIKQEILKYIEEKSKKINKSILDDCTASSISSEIAISRSLASQYLNDLVKDQYLIKIKSRPVVFLSKYQIEKISGKQIENIEFLSYDDLLTFIYGHVKNFHKLIGHDLGLKECIEKIKIAIHYPHGGLPIMIYGKHGSGKTFLASTIKDYFYDYGIIENDNQYVYFNCSNIDDKEFKKMVFGYVDNMLHVHHGVLGKRKEGLLVLDDISFLSNDTQEMLLQFLDTGTYFLMNDKNTVFHSETRLVFICNESPQSLFSSHFLSRFPSIIEIPSLKNRTIQEKTALIIHFFEQEALLSSCQIMLSDKLVDYLINYCCEEEVLTLKQCIIQIFARAYNKKESMIKIGFNHLNRDDPIEIIGQDESYYKLEEYNKKKSESLNLFIEDFLQILAALKMKKIDEEKYYELLFRSLSQFNESIIFNENYLEKPLNRYEKYVASINELLEVNMNMKISQYILNLFAKYLYLQSYFIEDEKINDNINEILHILKNQFSAEYTYVQEFSHILEKNFGVVITKAYFIVFVVDLILYDNNITNKKTLGLIMCHGNSTASSIANAVNTLLSTHIFDAFDMYLDCDITTMIFKLKDYLKNKKNYENLVLIVDMGSLTRIIEELKEFNMMNIAIINNASTPLSLEIGNRIKQDLSLEEIMQDIDKNIYTKYKIVHCDKKEKAILFTSENGTDSANRMRFLFEKSIPIKTDLKLISCDYLKLVEDKENRILDKYDILFVEGIIDPKIPGVDFINIGEIVSFNAINKINRDLSAFLNEEQIKEFNHNLLKNFSLENLVGSLTILNPGPLLNLVEECLNLLMQLIEYKISEKSLINLYIHVCCFVERMVTKVPVLSYYDIEHFSENNSDFIKKFKIAFDQIIKHYHIDIPDSEIAYIYVYIESDKVKDK